MALNSAADAVCAARRALELPAGGEGKAFHVRRLDKSESAYFLVHTDGHAVCLDVETGALLASAEAPRSPLILTCEEAIERTRLGATAMAELVWAPVAASQSMFDPIWAVTEGRHTLYVDQRGNVWDTFPAKRPGGGGSLSPDNVNTKRTLDLRR
jgi:hypothetical protein